MRTQQKRKATARKRSKDPTVHMPPRGTRCASCGVVVNGRTGFTENNRHLPAGLITWHTCLRDQCIGYTPGSAHA